MLSWETIECYNVWSQKYLHKDFASLCKRCLLEGHWYVWNWSLYRNHLLPIFFEPIKTGNPPCIDFSTLSPQASILKQNIAFPKQHLFQRQVARIDTFSHREEIAWKLENCFFFSIFCSKKLKLDKNNKSLRKTTILNPLYEKFRTSWWSKGFERALSADRAFHGW